MSNREYEERLSYYEKYNGNVFYRFKHLIIKKFKTKLSFLDVIYHHDIDRIYVIKIDDKYFIIDIDDREHYKELHPSDDDGIIAVESIILIYGCNENYPKRIDGVRELEPIFTHYEENNENGVAVEGFEFLVRYL